MPLKRYDKDQILDSCFELFVQEGYHNTTTVKLSEAAGISKALLFHHFKSKKNLYIVILERCFEQLARELKEHPIASFTNFFVAKENSGLPRLVYLRQHPKLAKFLYEAYNNTPNELKDDIHQFTVQLRNKYSSKEDLRQSQMKDLFDQINLRDGVLKQDAIDIIAVVDDYFRTKISTELTDDSKLLDDSYWDALLQKKKQFLDIIRFGIEQQGE